MEDSKKPYDLNLNRYKNHRRVFPWVFVIKIVVGLGMIIFIYYMVDQMVSAEKKQPQNTSEEPTEIEISF